MKHQGRSALGLGVLTLALVASPAAAQTTANGPYYATPSWDQTLPSSTRFIVLSNMASAAVLDRETGLVWQQSPGTNGSANWAAAVDGCLSVATGGRMGWRLPSAEELLTVWDPGTGTLFAGAPFTLPSDPFGQAAANFWTATAFAENTPAAAVEILFVAGNTTPVIEQPKTLGLNFWCVRGNKGTQSPQ